MSRESEIKNLARKIVEGEKALARLLRIAPELDAKPEEPVLALELDTKDLDPAPQEPFLQIQDERPCPEPCEPRPRVARRVVRPRVDHALLTFFESRPGETFSLHELTKLLPALKGASINAYCSEFTKQGTLRKAGRGVYGLK